MLRNVNKIYGNLYKRMIKKWQWRHTIIIFVAFFCYCVTLLGAFVFDDSEAVVKNKDVMPFTPLSNVFKNDFWGTDISLNSSHKSYRPLTILTYRFNVYLSGKLNAFHFHATNILFYIILCVVTIPVFNMFFRKKDIKDSDITFLSSLLFTVHPIHTEVVSGIVGRADILSAILFLLSILLYKKVVKKRSVKHFVGVFLLISAAVLCKETAITALMICGVYDALYSGLLKKGLTKEFFSNKSFIYRMLGLFVSGVIIIYFRLLVMNFEGPIFTKIDNPAAYSDSFFTKVLTYHYIYFLNLLLLLWPEWLCFDWSMGCIPLIEEICDIRIVVVIGFWVFILTCAVITYRKLKSHSLSVPVIMAASLVVFPFIPASNIFVKVGFVIAERTLLLPSLGFSLLVVLGLKKISEANKSLEYVIHATFYYMCVVFALRTIERNFEWLREEQLFTSALRVCPLNAKVHYNIAKVAADHDNRNLALAEYDRALELNPEYEQAMNNLANLLREDRRFQEAEILLRKAIFVRPNFAAAWMNLAIVLTNLNQPNEAEKCYLTAISHRPKYPDCYYNLGNLYLDMSRNDEALQAWEKAVLHRPTHTAAWSNTLVLLDTLNRFEEVLKLGPIALKHNPKSPALHFCIGNTLGKMQEFAKAEKHFLEAINLNPKYPLYYSNLGVLYHRWGKTEHAKKMYNKALALDPSMKAAENNRNKLLYANSNEIII